MQMALWLALQAGRMKGIGEPKFMRLAVFFMREEIAVEVIDLLINRSNRATRRFLAPAC